MGDTTQLQPFLKWAGGKRQLLKDILLYRPLTFRTYYEPFVGGGAMLFALQPERAVISDINSELVNAYEVLQNAIDPLMKEISRHPNTADHYYAVRNLDRDGHFDATDAVTRAARLIYLNKTCYNGLFRVNRQGQFNVPFGRYKQPRILNEAVLKSAHAYLNASSITILRCDFEQTVSTAAKDDFVYFDPPYHPVSKTSAFTSYSVNGFDWSAQRRLKNTVDELTRRGCKVMLSNSATADIRDLYKDYQCITLQAARAINSNADRRGKVEELLLLNYDPEKK